MVILRDEKRIKRLNRLSKVISFLGIGALVAGLILAFMNPGDETPQSIFTFQLVALLVGWIFSQVGVYLAHRYVRDPRPDEVLDKAVGRVVKNGRLYHYALPINHVLLSESGVIVLVPRYQAGQISVEEDKWKQRGLGLRRFFGQENIGNPTRDAQREMRILADFISKNAPEVEEMPLAALIVFTHSEQKELDLQNSRIPAMHHTKVKSYLRRKRRTSPMPKETYEALRHAFDQKAQHILEQEQEGEDE